MKTAENDVARTKKEVADSQDRTTKHQEELERLTIEKNQLAKDIATNEKVREMAQKEEARIAGDTQVQDIMSCVMDMAELSKLVKTILPPLDQVSADKADEK